MNEKEIKICHYKIIKVQRNTVKEEMKETVCMMAVNPIVTLITLNANGKMFEISCMCAQSCLTL